MKHSSRFIPVFLALLISPGFFSCEKSTGENPRGQAGFSIQLPTDLTRLKSDTGGTGTEVLSWHLLVSIENEEGSLVVSDELIPIYLFGTGYISENIELETGKYSLVKFMVLDPSGEVVYASPLKDSPLACLVNQPLPIVFKVNAGQVTLIAPEVLATGSHPPEDFGYVSFGFQIVSPLYFFVVCRLESATEMGPVSLTDAKLTVFGPGDWHYTFSLKPEINHLVIRAGAEMYDFLLEKDGYPSQKIRIPAWKLAATTRENPLVLTITPGTEPWNLLVLQPGPGEGFDAMISNLDPETNFGEHPYFEATFLSEPVLTVMRSNRSLIRFHTDSLPVGAEIKKVLLQLSYGGLLPVDTAFIQNYPGSNELIERGVSLQRITGPWQEDEVTWNNCPPASSTNQVFLPVNLYIMSSGQIKADVTPLFLDENAVSAARYGMLLRQYPEDFFPGYRFASSDYHIPGMRPRLEIYYTTE